MTTAPYILAFDTANEVVSIAVGRLSADAREVACIASRRIAAHRASNTTLLPSIDQLLRELDIARYSIACVACGRGPGSFTGVRICMAAAKGMASALEVPLVGVSTPDALAWELHAAGRRGRVLVVADAMRSEVYPQVYLIDDDAPHRTGPDVVVKAEGLGDWVAQRQNLAGEDGVLQGDSSPSTAPFDLVAGDALSKYAEIFACLGPAAPQDLWTVQGPGLLACAQQMWRAGQADPLDARRHDPALALPVYTRLSDAEENERARLAIQQERNLRTGVQDLAGDDGDAPSGAARSHDAILRPLGAQDAADVAALESQLMKGDAWNTLQVLDDLSRPDRIWWGAFGQDGSLQGYAGGQVVAGQVNVLKIAVAPDCQRRGIARSLLARLCGDARDLGADEAILEVRAGNEPARAFYEETGLGLAGMRPGYYQDGEDAAIYTGPLLPQEGDVAGMHLVVGQQEAATPGQAQAPGRGGEAACQPLILAIESSCDETAAAVAAGDGSIVADCLASQIDFHSRFGGVVPEIASRKHIEAICGVAQVCLERAAGRLGRPALRYRDLDAIAVTYTPGLVGALVVGVAFAKAAAWAVDVPFIGVNHLEGHLYANKIAQPDIAPPMVVSLVSGGHTMLVHVRDWGDYHVMGSTIDDAVGEAFDKVAKALGLGYPGGPVISRLAAQGNPAAIDFPRAMMHSGDLRFSLSGLKTAVITYINQQRDAGAQLNLPDIAASFQAAVIDVQVAKACTALDETGAREFCLGGGVAANPALRAAYQRACDARGVRLTMPPASACTDNAAMIALVALDRYAQGRFFGLDADAYAHSNLDEAY